MAVHFRSEFPIESLDAAIRRYPIVGKEAGETADTGLECYPVATVLANDMFHNKKTGVWGGTVSVVQPWVLEPNTGIADLIEYRFKDGVMTMTEITLPGRAFRQLANVLGISKEGHGDD